ncbi:MAG: response regulator [Helicobacteraceae bacterium]|nr:response regulator [Helicobacteraceae bacterium]
MAKILIVDDVKMMRHTIKSYATKLGFKEVFDAENGWEGVNKYNLLRPDVVTMDITMPERNGIENGIDALVAIRKDFPEASIIMLTSHGEQKQVIDAISKGAKGYILKPITLEKLRDALSKLELDMS